MDAETIAWIRSRPANVQAMMRRFPPGCAVVATRPLTVPAPGAVGRVVSYFDNGCVGVTCDGLDMRSQCQTDWLDVVGYLDGIDREAVARVLDEMVTQ
jgi:hypothetical protein